MLMILSLFLVVIMMILMFLLSYNKLMDLETISSYECGFSISSLARLNFSFRFFLISILFLIFDVEITLMLPIPYLMNNFESIFVIYVFFMILVVGLNYEYFYGSLDWMNFISKA